MNFCQGKRGNTGSRASQCQRLLPDSEARTSVAAMGKSNGLEDNNSPDDIKGTGHSCSRTLRFYHFYLPGGEKRSSTIGDFALPVVPFLDRSE